MGSSSKAGGKGKKRELSDHFLKLRQRLHDALSLGIRLLNNKEKRWECMDAEIQSHALRTMTAFINCVDSSLLRHPLVKESVSDMLTALQGILQAENERILSLAANVTMKLVCCLGNSICQYHMLEVIVSLSNLLSSCQLQVAISCAVTLNRILTNLGPLKCENYVEVWKAVEKTNALGSIICALQVYADGVHSIDYLTEMTSLLRTIVQKWPSSRYSVWNNSNLMMKLGDCCKNTDSSISVVILQLFSDLALCGNGAMKLLKNKELLSNVTPCMGTLCPPSVRIETLKFFQQLMRSAEGCSILTNMYCEPIVQAIIDAMDGWRSLYSRKIPDDQSPLVMEACRTATMTRWAGNHHSCFWKLAIDKVLLDILLGNCSTSSESQGMFSADELILRVYNNITDATPFIWDILGWLAIHCEENYLLKTEGKGRSLDVLVSCACAVAKDLIYMGRSSLSPYMSQIEPVSRAVLLMLLSPSTYISSQARYHLSEMVTPYGDDYLGRLLASLNLIAVGDVSLVSDSLHTAVNLINLACYSALPQYQKLIVKKKGINTLSSIIKRCLNSEIHVSRSSIASHLHSSSEGKTCCWFDLGDWEGEDILLFYCLQGLSQLIWFFDFVCEHHRITSKETVVCMNCGHSEAQDLINNLQYIMSNSFSPGPRWYAAYIMSFFGSYGFPSKLGKRVERALDDNEFTDLQFMLPNGQSVRVHGIILAAKCPYLLPRDGTVLKGKVSGDWSTNEQESDRNGRKLRHEVRISDRVDSCALVKILEYVYAGLFLVEDDYLRPLKILAKCCGLKSLSHMLHRKLPTWGAAIPSCDFTGACEPTRYPVFDIILEAKVTREAAWNCSMCSLSVPHMHAHKVILCASCDYLRALFQSGMQESYSQIIKVPIGWKALVKLVSWFYSGELPRIRADCIWNNMDPELQLHELLAYVELSSLAEFWFLEEVGEESLNSVVSCVNLDQKTMIEIIHFAFGQGQWKIVEFAVGRITPSYPKMRDAGDLESFSEEVVDMLRAEYVRNSQKES